MALLALVSCRQTGNTDYNPTDARTFGLTGDVKEVKVLFQYADMEDDWLLRMTFDEKGRVTLADYAFEFEYDENGQVICAEGTELIRDEKGRITSYGNTSDYMDEDFSHVNFEYDSADRTHKEISSEWEWSSTYTYVFEGKNVYPSEAGISGGGEGAAEDGKATYDYIKFDSKGNWTERKTTIVSVLNADENGGESDTLEAVEKRIITYWSDED